MTPSIPTTSPRRRFLRWPLIPIGLVGLLILFNCSGLPMPLWRPLTNLNTDLSADFGVDLPPGTTRIHSARMAWRDGGYFYCIEFPHGQRDPFFKSLTQAANAHGTGTGHGYQIEPITSDHIHFDPQPSWFQNRTPHFLPGLQVTLPAGKLWYFFPYPGNNRLYIARIEP